MKNLFFLLSIISLTTFGQIDFDHYKSLKCHGELPSIFTTSLKNQVKQQEEKILKGSDRYREQVRKKEFALSATYGLRQMVLNGNILFGDQLSNYVNDVANNILKNFEFSRKKEIEFFVVKSPYVNAFTTNEGKIFVSTALIAQLETEAQLAFILSHEVAHFEKGHVLKGYLFDKKVEDNSSSRYSNENSLLKKSAYSQEKEIDADTRGLEIFLKSKYNKKSILGVFDILQFSHLPIDEIKFEPTSFENKYFKIPEKYLIDTTNAIVPLENDENSTHPSAEIRAIEITSLLKKSKSKNSSHFLLGKERFIENRNLARFELSQILLDKRMYQALLYNNYVLSKDFPDSYYLDYTNSKALYFLSKYKIRFLEDDVVFDSDEIQGASQSLYYMIEQMPLKEFSLLAVNYIWNCHKKHPKSSKLKQLASTVLNEIVFKTGLKDDDFHRISPEEYIKKLMADQHHSEDDESVSTDVSDSDENSDAEDSYTRSSKYKNIKSKIKEDKINDIIITSEDEDSISISNSEKFGFIFVEQLKDSSFISILETAFANSLSIEKSDDKNDYEEEENKDIDDWNPRDEVGLGIDSLIFVDPIHLIFDTRKNDVFRIKKTTSQQKKLSESIIECSEAAGVHTVMIDAKDLKQGETDKFNDLVALNFMIRELQIHKSLDSIVLTDFSYLNEITEKYGISTIAWDIMVSITEKDPSASANVILGSIFLYPILPFVIYDAVTPNHLTMHFFYVFDIKKGATVFKRKYRMKYKPKASVVKSNLYHNLSQLKKKPVEEKKK
jgi:hypothetical protein